MGLRIPRHGEELSGGRAPHWKIKSNALLLRPTYLQLTLLIGDMMSLAAYYTRFLVLHMSGKGLN